METLRVEEKRKSTLSKKMPIRLFLGGLGLICLIAGIVLTGYSVFAGDAPIGFIFGLYFFGVVSLSVAYPETNKQYSKSDDFISYQNTDILHDPAYSSVSGNVYHSN